MANYDIFKPILYANEGGYCDKKGDSGGETWMGIARNYYPGFAGWRIIDENILYLPKIGKDSDRWKAFSKHLWTFPNLQVLVDSFYHSEFWDKMQGDKIANQSIANFIGDWGTNAGLTVPIKHCQRILNLTDDGKLGSKTVDAINLADGPTLFTNLKADRIRFYYDVVRNKPETKQFLNNWLSRTNSFNYKG